MAPHVRAFTRTHPLLLFIVFAFAAPHRFSFADSSSKTFDNQYFCMHVHSHPNYEKAFNGAPFGMFRTWDSAIGWPLIEPEKDKWNWELLDKYVRLASGNNSRLILTLGMTPRWAASNPNAPSPYGGEVNSSAPKRLSDWERFIRMMAERNELVYGGAIRHWELWNEPDNFQAGYEFYTGSVDEMIKMAESASAILKEINPANMIISPGITQVGQGWLDRFLSGGGAKSVDIIGFHFYWVFMSPTIADFEKTINGVKSVMAKNGCADKPIWVTETGFDVNFFKKQDARDMTLASLLIAPKHFGADAVCVYSMNSGVFTNLFDTERVKTTETGAAYISLQKWLLDSTVTEYRSGKSNSKYFVIARNGKTARIVWRRGPGTAPFEIDKSWGDTIHTLAGTDTTVPTDRIYTIGASPILISDKSYFSNPD